MTTIPAKRQRLRTIEMPLTLLSAGHLMRNIPNGLWQSLKRTSAISGKKFPVGSNVVMVMYELDGAQQSGAVHLEELPDDVRAVVEAGEFWKVAL
jgi:hypothetical protein